MARNGSEIGEPPLILALAQGKSVAETAALSGLSERTVSRRMKEPAIQMQVSKARMQLVSRALGVLVSQLAFGAATIGKLMRSESEAIQLGAARTAFSEVSRLVEVVDINPRLEELEQRFDPNNEVRRYGRDRPTS